MIDAQVKPRSTAKKNPGQEAALSRDWPTPLAHSLARHKWWILVAGLAGGLGLAAVATYQPPSYTASALLLVEPSARKILNFGTVATSLTTDRVGLDTQIGLMTSPPTLAGASERLVADGGAAGRTKAEVADVLDHEFAVRSEGKGNILRMTLTAPDPVFAAAAVNAVADQFIADQVERKRADITEASAALAARVSELAGDARSAERAAADFRRMQPGAEGNDDFYLNQISALKGKLIEANVELRMQEVRDGSPIDGNGASAEAHAESRQRVAFLDEALKRVRADHARFQQVELALGPLEEDAAAAQHILGEIRARLQEVTEQATFVTPDAIVVSAAMPPSRSSSPSRNLLGLMGFATFVMLAALVAVAIDQMRRIP